jgi:hypothetical protein
LAADLAIVTDEHPIRFFRAPENEMV